MESNIRLATPADGEALARIYAPSVARAATSFELTPPDATEMARRVEATLEHTPWLLMETEGKACGFAYASRHNERAAYAWSVNVSVYVAEAYKRRSVGRRLELRPCVGAPSPTRTFAEAQNF